MAKNLLNYDNLIEHLSKKGYKKIGKGEFIVKEYKDLEMADVLVVRKGQNYKEDLSKLKKEIEDSASLIEGERKEYGILFVDKYVIFLRRVTEGLKTKVVVLRKSLDKISPAFKKKYEKLLKDVGNWQYWDELFDRSDIIEEFYQLYLKSRENLVKKIRGIVDDNKKEELADNLLMQLLIVWYLQEKGFLDNNPIYLITKFKQYRDLGFNSYYDFLKQLFKAMMSEPNEGIFYKDDRFGRIVVTGPAPFLNGSFEEVEIPDKIFYIEGRTELLKKVDPKKVSNSDVPILNLFESRDWTEGNIDEFVLGAIFEKLMTAEDRKEKGAYYTPERITRYISDNTIKPYLIDRINEEYKTEYKSLDEFFKKDTDEKHYKFLFDELQNIKILDPACGSGHFLETAINILVEIYEKIRERAKELGFSYENFVILTANEKGEIIKEPLLTIDDENERMLKLKFHIIISRNIYGVDILLGAIKVARARLFLSLAKHFDARKETHARFPNVHFNLRAGNSLIGFADLKTFKRAGGQATLDQFFTIKDRESLNIELDKDLEDYIKKMDKVIGTNAYALLAEVKSHFGQKLTPERLEKVLRLRSDLINILLVSLNTDYAIKLKRLIDELTTRFNWRLNEEYLVINSLGIDKNELEKIGYFHWIMEFSEVFLKKSGFDIVIGNPPYVRQEKINDIVENIDYKSVLSKLYEPYENTFDFSMFFLLRSLELTKENGYHSFIITNKWLRAKYGKKIRKFLRENFTIKKVIDFNGVRVFVGATVDTLIYVIKNEKPEENNKIFYNNPKSFENIETGGYYVKQLNLEDEVWNFVDERISEIKEWIEKVGVPLKELDIKIFYGIKTGFNKAFIIDNETRRKLIEEDPKSEELIKPLLRGRDIGRYYVKWDKRWIIIIPAGFTKKLFKTKLSLEETEELFKKEYLSIYNHLVNFRDNLIKRYDKGDYWWELRPCDYYSEFEKPKIVWTPISGDYEFNFLLFPIYFVHSLFMITGTKPILKTLLLIMNSNIRKLLLKLFTNIGDIGTYAYGSKEKMSKIPIRLPKNIKSYEILADYLLFLNAKKDWKEKYKELINFFDKEIADFVVYELYFKEKLHEDGLYLEPKEYLLEDLSKHLKSINYDRWVELYWKMQLESTLTGKEKKELEGLEKKNFEIIKSVFEAVKSDREIMKLIEKIKQHEWVNIVEGNNQW